MEDNSQQRDREEAKPPPDNPPVPGAGQPYGVPASHADVPAAYYPQAAPNYATPQPLVYQTPMGVVTVAPKNPGVNLIVSFFLPGVGSMMAERTGIGILILGLWILSIILDFTVIGLIIGIPLGLGVWIWGMIDAYQGAKAWNIRRGIIS